MNIELKAHSWYPVDIYLKSTCKLRIVGPSTPVDVSRTIAPVVPGYWTRQSNVCDHEQSILGVRSGPSSVVLLVSAICDVLMQGKLSIDLRKRMIL